MIAWHVYPLGFVGASIRDFTAASPVRGLSKLSDWLEYPLALGCDAISLGPIFYSQSHGYDTLDYFRIDPRLGTEYDFDELIAHAHDLGLKVILDGVFNHISERNEIYLAALAGDEDAARYFNWPIEPFEGHGQLITLDHSSAVVSELVDSVLRHWMERGVDGWRMDAAYAVGPDFWAGVIPPVRQAYPGSWFFGEVIHGDYSDFVARSRFDSVTQYELWKAIWSSISNRNFFELSWCLGRHNEFVETFTPVTFIGNHDVTRIATQIGADRVPLALAILLTVGGNPHLYYGDEQGFTGEKLEIFGGDDAIRPAFPLAPAQLAPDGWWLHKIHQDLIALRKSRPWLARATTVDLELTTERYRYRSAAGGDFFEVNLDASRGSVVITDNSGVIFRYG